MNKFYTQPTKKSLAIYRDRLNYSYLNLPADFYTCLTPSPVIAPKILIFNEELAANLGLNYTQLNQSDLAENLAGNIIPYNATPYSQAYAGHQFGHFTMLGDGRAHIIGEYLTADNNLLDIQMKGSGRTPYSRGGDGRAALGPMLREYIISEAMHSLGIPTTRSLAVVATGEDVYREEELPGAILTRVASSHIRIGTFEFAAKYQDNQDNLALQKLLDYTIDRHYPHLKDADNVAIEFLKIVIEQQTTLIVHWMRVGFIHGVMNTDNMSIAGETIDYGPCAFMDSYNPDTVFSSIDSYGRYAYANQPPIAQWNIARLAESLIPLIDKNIDTAMNLASDALNSFTDIYQHKWLTMMGHKLGLFQQQPGDKQLINSLLELMSKYSLDYTNTFNMLSNHEFGYNSLTDTPGFAQWFTKWQQRRLDDQETLEESLSLMKSSNPKVIPRNHLVEEALTAAYHEELSPMHNLLKAVKNPYHDSKDIPAKYYSPPSAAERVYQTFCGT